MRRRLVLLGLLLAVVTLTVSTVGVASAGCGPGKGFDWREVNAVLTLNPDHQVDSITPLGKKSASSYLQCPGTGILEGRFRVLSTFFGTMDGWPGDTETIGSVTADLTSVLDLSLAPGGGTEQGVTRGDASIGWDGPNTIHGKIVGQVDLIMAPGWCLYPLAGGDVRLTFIVTGGTGELQGAKGTLEIRGNPVTGATVQGRIKVGGSVLAGH